MLLLSPIPTQTHLDRRIQQVSSRLYLNNEHINGISEIAGAYLLFDGTVTMHRITISSQEGVGVQDMILKQCLLDLKG